MSLRKSILSKEFRYTPAAKTDIKKTFARIRKEMREEREQAEQKVTQLKRKVAL